MSDPASTPASAVPSDTGPGPATPAGPPPPGARPESEAPVADAARFGAGEPQTLSRRIVFGWRCSGVLTAIVLGGASLAAEYFWLDDADWWPLPPYVLGGAVAALLLLSSIVMPGLAWRRWRWSIREHDVLLEFGVLWRTSRSIPRLRIQHVDVSVDPIDRLLGLANVTIYTAGTGSADARIPGLRPALAEAVREELLVRLDAADAADDAPGAAAEPPGPGAEPPADRAGGAPDG